MHLFRVDRNARCLFQYTGNNGQAAFAPVAGNRRNHLRDKFRRAAGRKDRFQHRTGQFFSVGRISPVEILQHFGRNVFRLECGGRRLGRKIHFQFGNMRQRQVRTPFQGRILVIKDFFRINRLHSCHTDDAICIQHHFEFVRIHHRTFLIADAATAAAAFAAQTRGRSGFVGVVPEVRYA